MRPAQMPIHPPPAVLAELAAALETARPKPRRPPFVTGLAAWDALLPGGHWPRGAVHELLGGPVPPVGPAVRLAAAAAGRGIIAWIDPDRQVYPPAVARWLDLERIIWIRPGNPRDLLWAAAECLRCPGVDVTLAALSALSRIQARRLQLAAERGGGVGLWLRPARQAAIYAAATRWLAEPIPGGGWKLQLLHGQGGPRSFVLEPDHVLHPLHPSPPVADRSGPPTVAPLPEIRGIRAYA